MNALLDEADLGLMGAMTDESPASTTMPVAARGVAVSRPRRKSAPTATGSAHKTTERGLFYFDIETVPDYSRLEQYGLEPIPEPAKRATVDECEHGPAKFLDATIETFKANIARLNPCDEYLDHLEKAEKSAPKPRKGVLDLIADVRNQDEARLSKIDAQRKEMATSPEMNRIVALGWAVGEGQLDSLVVAKDGPSEIDLLERFWSFVETCGPLVGFNILGFDLPTIFVRSALLGVRPSRRLDLKPWGNDCIDLMAVRFPKSSAKRLKWLAQAMGIAVPAGDVDGSQVEELWKTDPTKVGEYVRSDVSITRELHWMYRGYFC